MKNSSARWMRSSTSHYGENVGIFMNNMFQSVLKENEYHIDTSTSFCFNAEVNCDDDIIKSAELFGDNLKKYGREWIFRQIIKYINGVSRFFHKPEATIGAFF